MKIEKALQLTPEQMVRKLICSRWSQEKIANHLEVSQPTISRILSGKNKDPHFSLVKKLIAMLVEVEDFDTV